MPVTVHHGDCLDVLAELPDASVAAVVTDPPYGLEFMGKEWDSFGRQDVRQRGDATFTSGDRRHGLVRHGVGGSYGGDTGKAMRAFQQWCEQWAAECLRVLKPGGHMLAFGGTRTWHRLACAIEDAGFEVRDNIAWLYGSGFPKSLDVSKAIDKAECAITAPATPAAQQWQGWGTALKPAFEPIVVARKPLAGTVAANVLTHGTGALNIDGCRIGTSDAEPIAAHHGTKGGVIGFTRGGRGGYRPGDAGEHNTHTAGRWPTNVALDDTTADQLDTQTGVTRSRIGAPRGAAPGDGWRMTATGAEYDDEGGTSRFFPVFRYEPKAPTGQRPTAANPAATGHPHSLGYNQRRCAGPDGPEWTNPSPGVVAHPTVKPLDLMRWLVRLVTPPGGTVLDPFAGSGTTGHAAALEGVDAILIEREADYLPLIAARLNAARWGATVVRHTAPPPAPDGSQTLALFDLEAPA